MRISDMFKKKKTLMSFEVFPPKPDFPLDTVFDTIYELNGLNPDFISVTYGAGGSNSRRTVDIASRIKNTYDIEALPHLTCVNSHHSDIDYIINSLREQEIENILALRGDPPRNIPDFKFSNQQFRHASDLISYIKNRYNFCIGGACYPEGHLEARSLRIDITSIKYKVEQGTDFLISQIFFDNEIFLTYLNKLRNAGINVPVSASIMPVYNTNMIKKMTLMCGTSLPKKLITLLNKYEHNPDDLTKAGVEYAAKQISGLIKHGVSGIHLCTMNRSEQVKQIIEIGNCL